MDDQEKCIAAFEAWMDSERGAVSLKQAFIAGTLYGIREARAVYSPPVENAA